METNRSSRCELRVSNHSGVSFTVYSVAGGVLAQADFDLVPAMWFEHHWCHGHLLFWESGKDALPPGEVTSACTHQPCDPLTATRVPRLLLMTVDSNDVALGILDGQLIPEDSWETLYL